MSVRERERERSQTLLNTSPSFLPSLTVSQSLTHCRHRHSDTPTLSLSSCQNFGYSGIQSFSVNVYEDCAEVVVCTFSTRGKGCDDLTWQLDSAARSQQVEKTDRQTVAQSHWPAGHSQAVSPAGHHKVDVL